MKILSRMIPRRILKPVLRKIARVLLSEIEDLQRYKLGEDVYLEAPRRIDGIEYITVGKSCSFGRHIWLSAYDRYYDQTFNPQIIIGDNVYIGNSAFITCTSRIEIGSGCVFSDHVYITDTFHGVDPKDGLIVEQNLTSKGPVIIGENTFMGYQACVLPGVVLGKNCVVGTSAVVTQSFPDYSMLAGVPARIIKRYSFEHSEWLPCSD